MIVLFVALLLTVPAGTAYAFNVTNLSVAASTTSAGKHPDLTISMDLPDVPTGFRAGQLRSLELALPTGLMGNATAPAQCTDTQFATDSCPQDSLVGRVTITDDLGAPFGGVTFPGKSTT